MKSKWTDPKLITYIATLIVVVIHKVLGWQADIEKVAAVVGIIINYLIVQYIEDAKRAERGEHPAGFNSVKWVAMVLGSLAFGILNYFEVPLDIDAVGIIVGFVAAAINGKFYKDMKRMKGDVINESTQNNIGGGPAV